MEDIKTYIESGILELYVLGDLTPEERAEVEAMAALHPQVKAEIEDIERVIGALADSYAVEPSYTSKEAFLNKLNFEEINTVQPASDSTIKQQEEAKIIPLNNSKLNFYKYSFAASFALLLLSIAAIFVLYNNLQNSKQQLALMQNSNQDYANQVNYLDEQVKKTDALLGVYTNPDFKIIELKGTANSPESKMVIAFNPKQQKVLIDMKTMDMPGNDTEHQYQLWALVDGKPVDLGVFDADKKEIGLKDMKTIGKAQAFAVTLEPKGGSVNPTLEKMMVMGAI